MNRAESLIANQSMGVETRFVDALLATNRSVRVANYFYVCIA